MHNCDDLSFAAEQPPSLPTLPDDRLEACPAKHNKVTIPEADLREFSLESAACRAHVQAWLRVIEAIINQPGKRGTAIARVARAVGEPEKTVSNHFYAWKKGGWSALIDRRKFPGHAGTALPRQFLEHWRTLCGRHRGRDTSRRQAHRALLEQLVRWERGDDSAAIPGYAAPPRRLLSTQLPEGWHYRNLMRYKPSRFEQAIDNQGRAAASNYRPQVRATRVGLDVGQVMFFDDEEEDVLVTYCGINNQPTRPLGFHALDFVSGANFARGWKPTIVQPDGGKRKLTEEDFTWFVLHVLTAHGYRADVGTTLVVEHGTAAIREEFERCISEATGGRVTIDRSGRYGDPTFRGMLYPGQRRGNFKYKAPLESIFSLVRSHMSALPGPTGKDRNHKPEEQPGLIAAASWYMKTLDALMQQSPERALLLRNPLLHFSQFVSIAEAIIEHINRRTDHHLEGFEGAGFVTAEFTLDGAAWQPIDALALMSHEQRLAVEAFIALPGRSQVRKLSPHEVWQRGQKKLRRVPRHLIPVLCPHKFAIEAKCEPTLELKLDRAEFGPEPVWFMSPLINERGHEIPLRRGETYMVYANPFDASAIEVCEAAGSRRGAWIGTAYRTNTPTKIDHEELGKIYGAAMHAVAPEVAAVERRTRGLIMQRQGDKLWNQQVTDLKRPLLPKEREQATRDTTRQKAAAAVDAAELDALITSAPASEPSTPPDFEDFTIL